MHLSEFLNFSSTDKKSKFGRAFLNESLSLFSSQRKRSPFSLVVFQTSYIIFSDVRDFFDLFLHLGTYLPNYTELASYIIAGYICK